MNKTNSYFKIGEIANLFNIGIDSIRYYEKVGILKPKRDPNSNYRLYSLNDIRKITMIRELLSLNFSMEEIKDFENNKTISKTSYILEKELNIINEKIVTLMQQKENIQAKLSNIHNSLIKKDYNEIQVLDLFDRPCIMVSKTNIPDDLVDYSLLKYMKVHPQRIDTIGTCDCFTLDIKNSNPKSDYYRTKNVFFYSENLYYEGNYTLKAGKYLSLMYTGSPKKTKKLMPSLFEYAKKHKLKVISDPIELCYIDGYETSNEDEYITEIQLPVIQL